MSYIKSYNPDVANLVGIQAALLLNHIKFWSESKNVDKVYRTNKQLSDDFEGSLSESQIQRAKKKLVDFGLVLISHDMGHTRTTHYSLTEKALSLLNIIKKAVKEVVKKVKTSVKPKSKMEESFKEGFENKDKVKGFSLSDALNKAKCIVKTVEEEPEPYDEDEYFAAIDAAMNSCVSPDQYIQESSFTVSNLFKRIPNIDILEKNRRMLDDAKYYSEVY